MEDYVYEFERALADAIEQYNRNLNKIKEDKVKEPTTKTTGAVNITPSLVSKSDNSFVISKKVGEVLTNSKIELNFSYMDDNEVYHMGITDAQLLAILLYRFRNSPEKYKLVKDLLYPIVDLREV